MNLLKRIWFFLLTNIAILLLFSLILFAIEQIFGINLWQAAGQSYFFLLVYAAIFWFLGSFVSLFISKWMAKRAYGIIPISASSLYTLGKKEKIVWDTVFEIAQKNGIKMPEVWIYQSSEPNAFATWATKNSSLIAVSSWLLDMMTEDELEAVIGHEMSHILNGDMVTMTLLQWVMNTFVIFFARIIAEIINSRTDGKLWVFWYYGVYIALQLLLGIFASIIVMWFSRHREFRADEGSSRFVWKEKMIRALEALKKVHHAKEDAKFATMQISTRTSTGFKKFFMSHPPLDDRIKNLQDFRY